MTSNAVFFKHFCHSLGIKICFGFNLQWNIFFLSINKWTKGQSIASHFISQSLPLCFWDVEALSFFSVKNSSYGRESIYHFKFAVDNVSSVITFWSKTLEK